MQSATWRLAIRPATLVLVAALTAAGSLLTSVSAQAQAGGQPWSEPLNLSRSGGATNPTILADSGGGLHVLWQDVYADLVYVRNVGAGWEAPVALDLPFAGLAPKLVADGSGWVHAFWVDEDLNLLHQRAPSGSLGDAANWSAAATLASDVVTFAVAEDADHRLQVAYVRARETSAAPAGIYSLQSQVSGAAWGSPAAVYESPYFRTLLAPDDDAGPEAAAGAALAHVAIAAAALNGATQVYVTWDQPGLNQVLLAHSADGGQSWSEPAIIDGPDASSPYKMPQHLRVSAGGSDVLLLWDGALRGGFCSERYRISSDGGASWQAPGDVLPGTTTCPEAMQLLPQPEGATILLATLQGQAYLLAWDGRQWSLPQSQGQLDGFINPTSFNFVDLDCLNAASWAGELSAVACEAGTNGDIWLRSRTLGAVSDWFAAPSGWASAPVTAIGEETITGLAVSAEADGTIQAIWTQPSSEEAAPTETRLLQAAWREGALSGPFEVFGKLPSPVNYLETAIDAGGRLLAFWSAGAAQAVYFSGVEAQQAGAAASWSAPETLLSADLTAIGAQVAAGEGRQAFVVYSVPLNEARGIYVARSENRGAAWSEPSQVFDGTGGGCPMVDAPSLAVTGGTHLHVLWTCSTLPGGAGPLTLYSARSLDAGQTWLPVERRLERPVTWSQIVAAAPGLLHQVWQETDRSGSSLWHAMSTDDGVTWSAPISLAFIDGQAGPASLAVDTAGGLHLLQAVGTSQGDGLLRYWVWDGATWAPGESLSVVSSATGPLLAFDSVVGGTYLAVVYARRGAPDVDGQTQTELVYSALPIAVSGNPEATPVATSQTPAATATSNAEAMETPLEATATLTFSLTPPGANTNDSGGPGLGLVLGALSAAVVVLAVAVVGVLRARNR
ncbi:MAG: exo-alpha-sialidase [Anaerolineales bacterium]|nr:exo-alpha-sialidase [Anaerolineales bacterium]